jgi:pyruvate-formate lyase-activating enzyme
MSAATRPYLFYDTAVSICSTCYRRVDAKIVFEDTNVFMLKRCPDHGFERVLIADDVDYYRRCREVFIKPPEMPARYNTPIKYGCPYDCGLCPDHEQHSCLSLVEICDACNLSCPICYAESGQHRTEYKPLDQVERMLDAIVTNELHPDIVQISGGEPTIHPQFFEILDAAKRRPIQHLMVNTNGIRIAQDEAFAQRLATYMPRFELYLQWDSLKREPLMQLRGADLRSIREKALARLNELGISTTLVVTVARGVNDDELGALVDFALQQPCVRGITFQPIQQAGRTEGYDKSVHRLTLTEVRRRILSQTSNIKPEDLIPVPCHPDSLAMAYALKIDGKVLPLTGLIPPDVLIDGGRNTIIYEQDRPSAITSSNSFRQTTPRKVRPTASANSSAACPKSSPHRISAIKTSSASSSSSSSMPSPSTFAPSRRPASTSPTPTASASSPSTPTTCSTATSSNKPASRPYANARSQPHSSGVPHDHRGIIAIIVGLAS